MRFFLSFFARQLSKPSGWFGRLFMAERLNRMNAEMNALTLGQLQLQGSESVLEIGFGGEGLIEQLLADTRVLSVAGVDLSPEMTGVSVFEC